ncbi:L,D-transpeptidase [Hoeflea prorocentri]|uniref:L,D-transpeptidase n=1 Tax=Hoeflea prorocentri TaxID=1922333 RepID=A0A9X3ZJK4_9HYPH|nr:L,D-transpeptidase [Hoeflea prorocentri]MCY6382890.1 L,D-transpeptidase [Hoeflea prorocentri]MDA5400690.1 L,D-transpeptidase [Hoeflea prorocentri]
MDYASHPTRRRFLAGSASLGALALAGCTTTTPQEETAKIDPISSSYKLMYGPLPDEKFPIPAVDLSRVPSKFYRRQVDYFGPEPPGTVVVDTSQFYLYLVQENRRATRYGVGLGRAGFEWSGRARIAWKQEWPKWTPPASMIEREPELEQWSAANGGMPPGLNNPLGARALYIFEGNIDTLYRVHGSPEYWTIGKAVSSGCVRMMNQDAIDLYNRVPTRSQILVI